MMSTTDETNTISPLRSYLELLRLPKVFTAMADVAMGFFFVQAAWAWNTEGVHPSLLPVGAWTLGLLVLSSSLLYAAGMALNDVFDVEIDNEEQPYRPLPSGRISLRSARWLAWQLLLLGVAIATGVAVMLGKDPDARTESLVIAWLPAIVAVGLAVLIVLYNAGLKRTLLGPAAMGACRMLNVLLGMSVLREPWELKHWLVAGGIGVYIAGVTWFARNDARRSDRRQLAAAALVMLAGVALVGSLPWVEKDLWINLHQEQWRWNLIVLLLGGFLLVRCLSAILQPSPGPVRATVSRSIMALIFLDAAACYAACGPQWAIFIALLVLPTVLLERWVRE